MRDTKRAVPFTFFILLLYYFSLHVSSSHSMFEYAIMEEHSCVQYSIVSIMHIKGIFRLLS